MQAAPKLDPVSISKALFQHVCHQHHHLLHPKACQQHCENLYSTGLATAANIQQKSVKANTLKARRAAVKELAEWMHSMQVRNMLKGCANHATELGYQKRGVVPLTQLEMHTMLSSMFQLLIQVTSYIVISSSSSSAGIF